MNLILILVGMGLFVFSTSWPNRIAVLAASCLAIGLVWGVLIGDSIGGGVLVALVNLAVGLALGAGIRWTLDRVGDGARGMR